MPSSAEAATGHQRYDGSVFEAIGTVWRIGAGAHTDARLGDPLDAQTLAAVLARIEQFDHDWSRFRDDGFVGRVAREPGIHQLPADAPPLFSLYRELHAATAGRLSPLVGRSLEQLGYDAEYRLRPAGEPVAAPPWDDAIAVRASSTGLTLETVAPVVLDVGAAGKGYLVDLVGEVLVANGVTDSVVDAGGDARVRGERSTRVALEHPADASKAVGLVELRDAAIAASAPNRRAWGDGLHHIIDALSGHPVAERAVATWVIAPTAMLADGIATAMFLADPDELGARFEVEWAMMGRDGSWRSSAQWPGELFAKGERT